MAEVHRRIVGEYLNEGKHDLAIKACLDGMNLDPNDDVLLMQFGFANMQVRNFGLALHLFKILRDKNPQDFATLHNLGLAEISVAPFSGDERFLDVGEEHLKRALKKAPENPRQTINGLAQICLHRGNWQGCIDHAERSLKMEPKQPGLEETYGMALLAAGRAEGFARMDEHIPSLTRKPKPLGDEPYWDGTKGTKLFVQGEQGLGDEISFASIVSEAAKHNDIVLECDPRLGGLFKRSLSVRVEPTRNKERDWDFEPDAMCLSGTLAKHYRKDFADFPRKAFLIPDPERRVQWKALLDTLPGKKVGIAWKGGVPMNFAGRRSLELSGLASLLRTPGITWVSLEYKDPSDEIKNFCRKNPGVNMVHWSRAVGKGADYDDTAALVAELDCVVSVCTSVVHLCGAIGKECHVLVPKIPRWFYESDSQKHRWYDSLILYREKEKWPLEAVKDAINPSPVRITFT